MEYGIYKCFAIVEIEDGNNKVEIMNVIRSLEGVITVDIEKKYESKFLNVPSTAHYSKSLIRMKYLSEGDAEFGVDNIKMLALEIEGVRGFLTIKKSIEKI